MPQAVQVPISLLHQRVFSTGQRLPKWEGLPEPKKAHNTIFGSSVITGGAGRVISPCAKPNTDRVTLFQTRSGAWYRKYFFLVDYKERCTCRNCKEIIEHEGDLVNHIEPCRAVVGQTLNRMLDDKICAVCEKWYTQSTMPDVSIPVCDENCLEIWDHSNPDVFEEELKITKDNSAPYKAYMKRTEGLVPTEDDSVKNIQSFFDRRS